MSHQTGIEASKELLDKFAKLHEKKTRLLQIGINNEQLVLEKLCEACGTWEKDYDKLVLPLLDTTQPCYILYRLDSRNNLGYEWLFLTWSPDNAPVRQKMLFAGTRATLKLQFGGGKILEEIFGTVKEELSLDGYTKYLESKNEPPPLSQAEEELECVKRNEKDMATNVTPRKTLPGISFPVTEDAIDKLQQLRDGDVNYVRLVINIAEETIDLEECDVIDVEQLQTKVPSDHARYHIFKYKHTHESDYMETVVFIYSMPGYSCPIKERMLYSTCKAPVTQFIEVELGCEIEKKIEVGSGEELTEDFIYDEVHPKLNIVKQAFSKPKGPAGRGPRRVTKQ